MNIEEIKTEIGLAQRALHLSSGHYAESASHIDTVIEAGQATIPEIEAAASGLKTYLSKATGALQAGKQWESNAEEAVDVLTNSIVGDEGVSRAIDYSKEAHRSCMAADERRTEAVRSGKDTIKNIKNTINGVTQYFTSNRKGHDYAYLAIGRIDEALVVFDDLQLESLQAFARIQPTVDVLDLTETAREKAAEHLNSLDHARDHLLEALEDDKPGDLQDLPELRGLAKRLEEALVLFHTADGKQFKEFNEILQAASIKVSEADVIYLQELTKRVLRGVDAHGKCNAECTTIKAAITHAIEAGNALGSEL